MTTVKLLHRYHRLAPPNKGIFEAGSEIEVDDATARQMADQKTASIVSTRPDPVIETQRPNLITVDWSKENEREKETIQ